MVLSGSMMLTVVFSTALVKVVFSCKKSKKSKHGGKYNGN